MLITADCITGIWYRTDTITHLHVTPARSGMTKQVIVAFPGFIMSGNILGKAFAPYLDDNDAMITVQYAERGIDITKIYQRIIEEIELLHPTFLRIYGASMGGMCAKEFLDLYERHGAPFGKVVLVLDTSPSGVGDIKQPRVLFHLAFWYRGGPLTSAIWALASQSQNYPPSETGTNAQVISEAHHAGAWVGMPAITSQAAYINEFPQLTSDKLASAVERVVYLRGLPSNNDPLVRIDSAIVGWRLAFPDLRVVKFIYRQERWHLPLIERPKETMRMILAA